MATRFEFDEKFMTIDPVTNSLLLVIMSRLSTMIVNGGNSGNQKWSIAINFINLR
jgi:hypothetical protein